MLSQPSGHCDLKATVRLPGGAALYPSGKFPFKCAISGRAPVSQLLGMVALGRFIPEAPHLEPRLLSAAATAVLVALAAWENHVRCRMV